MDQMERVLLIGGGFHLVLIDAFQILANLQKHHVSAGFVERLRFFWMNFLLCTAEEKEGEKQKDGKVFHRYFLG
jgi:hypothetical protein